MFRERPILERLAAAREAGFNGVEIQVLEEAEPTALATAATAADIPVVLINVSVGDYREGGIGLSGVPGREAQFVRAAGHAFDAAARLDAKFVHLGPSRVPKGVSRDACCATWIANAEAALRMAEAAPFTLLLEPMNPVDAPTVLYANIDEAAALLRTRLNSRIGLLFDLYHLAMAGDDPVQAALRHADLIRHVQFSDAPGRREPGTGRIDFAGAFAALENAGYAGGYGAEYFPDRPTAETLGWLADFKADHGRGDARG
jgi:hydroxypyruvate isomerase